MNLPWYTAFRPKEFWPLLKAAAADWSHDRAPRLGAALAYYTVFSIVPLLIVIIAIIGLVFGQEAAQGAIIEQISNLVGEQSAAAIKDMIERAEKPTAGIVSTLVAVVVLLSGAAGLFGQLKAALDTVWGVEAKEGRGIWGFIKDNFLSFATVLGTAFLLLVSLILSAALAAMGKWFGNLLPVPEAVLQIVNFLLSFAVITGLFAMIFKILPEAHIAWPDVWMGAAITSFLFTIGKFAIGLYLGKSHVASGFGAAGSLVVMLVWVYYSAQILLFGAEFTQVYANRFGEHIQPSEDAKIVSPEKAASPDRAPALKTKRMRGRQGHVTRHRWWAIGGFIVGLIVVTLLLATVLLEGPLKRYAEDQAAQRLRDYEVQIGAIHVHPFRLALELNDVVVRQRAHPEPPLATIPSLMADARFLPLLTGTLDLSLRIERPALSATGEQVDKVMHTEDKEEIKEEAGAWQDTIRGMMPVRLSLSISQGEITYTSKPSVAPIRIEQFEIAADNVTNRPAGDDLYPSEVHVSARLPDQAELALNGRADFLAKPDPRIEGELQIKHFSLTNLMPVTGQYNVQLHQGALDVTGHVEHSGNTTVVDINQFTLEASRPTMSIWLRRSRRKPHARRKGQRR